MAYRRNRRGRYSISRPVRLVISLLVLIALVVAVVLIVRGCSAGRDQIAAPGIQDTAALPDTDFVPDDELPDAEDVPDEEPPGDDAPIDPDDPANAPVDLAADLAEAEAEPVVPAGDRKAVIRSMGDIIIHTPLIKTAYDAAEKAYDFSPYFSLIGDSMAKADYSVINVDGPMGGKKFGAFKAYPQFNTPPQVLNALRANGIDMVTLANNHALDTYFDGLMGTIANVEKAGLAHIGAYRSKEEFNTPTVVTINGIRVGFLNYTTGTNNLEKSSDPAATEYGLRYTNNSNAVEDIKAVRAAGAEVVVVYMHWGVEYEREVSANLKKRAEKMVAAGADVIVGGHPHVVLPCKWVSATDESGATRRGLVLYSLGNFLSDQRARYRDSGIIFEFTLQDNPETGNVEVVSPRYIPTYVHRFRGTKNFDYRIMTCASIIDNPPKDMGADVVKRVNQVWNELKALMADGPAKVAKN